MISSIIFLLLLAAGIGLFIINQQELTRLRPMTDHYATAEALAAGVPDGIWFPFNPTVTLYSDGSYYHDGDGLFVRTLIGSPITFEHLRRHLPANFQAIAQSSATTNWNLVEATAPPNATQSRFGSWNVTAWAPESPDPSPPGTD